MKLAGKVTVVIGAAGLLGRAFVRCILKENGVVVLADNNVKEGQLLAEQLSAEHPNGIMLFVPVDISDVDSICNLIVAANSSFGRIDAVVNAAYPRGPAYGARFEDVSYANFCSNTCLQLGGYFLTAQQFASFFKRQGYGNVITLASIYGVVAPRFDIYRSTQMTMPVEYAAVKAALIHLNKYMARYFAGCGIRFNCISPGGVLDSQPSGFVERYNSYGLSKGMLDREDICGALIFLLSDDSRYLNGQNLIIDDGWTT